MNGAQRELIDHLRAGDAALVGNTDWQMTGSAFGPLKVLFINGDFTISTSYPRQTCWQTWISCPMDREPDGRLQEA